MSRPSNHEIALLKGVADELREVFAERGHNVDRAMETDPAFGSGRSRSAVRRDLAVDTASRAASRLGLDFRPVNGDGREFRCPSTVDRRYRLLRGRRDSEGSMVVAASSDSVLAKANDSLFREERWAFVWTVDGEGLIGEVVLAEIVDFVEGTPGHLVFGLEIPLESDENFSDRRFLPTDEDLEGFDEDEGHGEEFGAS